MYLLTVTILIIGLLGIYSQMLAVQTARIAAAQTGFGQTMLAWHAAAISMAANIIDTNLAGYTPFMTTGCSLTLNAPAGFPPCPAPVGTGDTNGTVLGAGNKLNLLFSSSLNTTICVNLPATCAAPGAGGKGCASCTPLYDTSDYQFYSVLYKESVTGMNLVVTFVPPATISAANPAPGFLTLANNNMVGFTQSDLQRQLQNSTAGFAIGLISNSHFVPDYSLMPSGVYNVPASVPNGSVAIAGSPDGM